MGYTTEFEGSVSISGRQYREDFRHFTFDHELNGVLDAQGERQHDQWRLDLAVTR